VIAAPQYGSYRNELILDRLYRQQVEMDKLYEEGPS